LNCRFWQPAWLAVVLVPLAALSRCAAADQSAGNGQQQVLAASADRQHDSSSIDGGRYREASSLSPMPRQLGGVGYCSTKGEVGVVLKAAWPSGKFHASRRGGERRLVASLGCFAAMPAGLMASAGPMPTSLSVLSAEYALLRRLEL